MLKLIFFLAISMSLYADWDPTCLKTASPHVSLDVLHKRDFIDLKKKVFVELNKSWCSAEKANLIMDVIAATKPSVCVEVGVFTGSSLLPVVTTLSYLHHGHAYGIDTWSNIEAVRGLDQQDPNYEWWSTVNMDEVVLKYLTTMSTWQLLPHLTTIYSPSKVAVEQFEAIDFLNLDGNFSENGSTEDAQLYLPKVKKGGYILLSNAFQTSAENHLTKMKALSIIVEQCEIVAEIENSNTILFQKQ